MRLSTKSGAPQPVPRFAASVVAQQNSVSRLFAVAGLLLVLSLLPFYIDHFMTLPWLAKVVFPLFAVAGISAFAQGFVRRTTFSDEEIVHRTALGAERRHSYADIRGVEVRPEFLDIAFEHDAPTLRVWYSETHLSALVEFLKFRVASLPFGRVLEEED